MEKSAFLHQKIAKLAVIAALFFAVTTAILFSAFYQREGQLDHQIEHEFAKFVVYTDSASLVYQASNIVVAMASVDNFSQLATHFSAYQATVAKLRQQPLNGVLQLTQIQKRLADQQSIADILRANAERNELLKQNIQIQLQLLLAELDEQIIEKQNQADSLYRQFTEDKLTDRVTASRARAHVELIGHLNLLNKTQRILTDIDVMFSRLSVAYPLDEFDHQVERVNQLFVSWQAQLTGQQQASDADKKLLEMLSGLSNLMLEPQVSLAKWRGQLRTAQELITNVELAQSQLNQWLGEQSQPQTPKKQLPNILEPFQEALSKVGLTSVVGLITLALAMIFLIAVYRAYQHSKKQGQELSDIAEAMGKAQIPELNADYQEVGNLIQALKQIETPEHSEDDYQALLTSKQYQQGMFLKHLASGYFSLELPSDAIENIHALELCYSNAPTSRTRASWRHAINRQTIAEVIVKLKSGEFPFTVKLENKWHHPLVIIIDKTDSGIEGLIASNENEVRLTQEFSEKLEHQQADNQALLKDEQSHLAVLHRMLTRAMLQNQNINKTDDELPLQMQRQLNRLQRWCVQQQGITVTNDKPLQLTEIALEQLFLALTCNIACENRAKKNALSLLLDPKLAKRAQLPADVIYQLVLTLAQVALMEQVNATALLAVSVTDVSALKQQVKIAIDVTPAAKDSKLPQLVQLFSSIDWQAKQCSNGEISIAYLLHLAQKMHVIDGQLQQNENGYSLSLVLPITAVKEQSFVGRASEHLINQRVVLVDQGSQITKQARVAVEQAGGSFEQCHTTDHLLKLLHVKHLKQHHIATVIIGPTLFHADHGRIEQHIHSLAKPLQPNIMVVQPAFSRRLHQTGLYSISAVPGANLQLQEALEQQQSSAALIAAPELEKYRFLANPVEILLSVEQIEQYLPLVNVLHWLGFQVQVLNRALAKSSWQSGQYLLLITDHSEDVLIEMQAGKTIRRQVFALNQAITEQLLKQQKQDHFPWQIDTLPNVEQLEQLVHSLSTWLKPLPIKAKVSLSEKSEKVKPSKHPVSKQVKLLEADVVMATELECVLDLNQYAVNQGSAELAALMLDDYLAELVELMQSFEQSLAKGDKQQQLVLVENMQLLAKIVAARPLQHLIEQLLFVLDSSDADHKRTLLTEINDSIEQLVSFSEAI